MKRFPAPLGRRRPAGCPVPRWSTDADAPRSSSRYQTKTKKKTPAKKKSNQDENKKSSDEKNK
jgi:hypothetical protein